MTATLTYRPNSSLFVSSPSAGTSSDATGVVQRIRELLESLACARSLQGEVFQELIDTFLDCRNDDWDGYEAKGIPDKSYTQAVCFLKKIIHIFPAPVISASPRGALTFEWIVSDQRRFIVSLNGGEQIAFAGIFGSETVQGVGTFVSDIPAEITNQLARLHYI